MNYSVSKQYKLNVSPDELRMLHTAVTDRINVMTTTRDADGQWLELQASLNDALHS